MVGLFGDKFLFKGENMNFLASKRLSLACAILNGAFAIQAFYVGNWLWALVCLAFCAFCANNYRNAE